MPWTAAQHRLFEAAAHDPAIAAAHHMGQGKAATMAAEGIKGSAMTSTTPPASNYIHGPTSMRRSPMTDEVRKRTLIRSLKGY